VIIDEAQDEALAVAVEHDLIEEAR
jgi:hypothetical protein